MEIRNLVFRDYFLFRKKINISLTKFFKLIRYSFVKVCENNTPLMIWQLDYINNDISYIGEVFFLDKPKTRIIPFIKYSSINTLKYVYETKKDEGSVLEPLGFRKDDSNIVMKMCLNNKIIDTVNQSNVSFMNFRKGVHDKLRCDIQNEVFYSKKRVPISVRDIMYEYNRSFFINDMAVFIKVDDNVVGYGQILLLENKYTIANLGILNNYQGKGYGRLLLTYLIGKAVEKNIKELYIKVKESNIKACNLYKKMGFEEEFKVNVFEISQE